MAVNNYEYSEKLKDIIKTEDGKYYVKEDVIVKESIIFSIIKRLFDLISSIIAVIILFIPMIFIAFAIKINSPGPIIYRQERLGVNGKKFYINKFRSMRNDAEKNGPQWADKDDVRVTKVGNFLRKSRLDEIPQFFNVIKGDMSLIGPRPEREVFYKEFSSYINGFDKRLLVKPGITGLAQVNGGYENLPEEKIIFDVYYIENMNLKIDVKIIFETIKIVFSHEGAR